MARDGAVPVGNSKAIRVPIDVRYNQIPPKALERVAKIFAEGEEAYGADNYRMGLPFSDIFNHMLRHYVLECLGDKSEDHLGKIAWAAMAAMQLEEDCPEANDLTWTPEKWSIRKKELEMKRVIDANKHNGSVDTKRKRNKVSKSRAIK